MKYEITFLDGNGSFDSPECVQYLDESDLVITNPPFSLFRSFMPLLMKHKKEMLILGDINAVGQNGVFEYIRKNQLWLGATRTGVGSMYFEIPPGTGDGYSTVKIIDGVTCRGIGTAAWFTNIGEYRLHKKLIMTKTYAGHEDDYPAYDNYSAINCDKTLDIPGDYYGPIGVPVSFLSRYDPNQFKIIGCTSCIDKDQATERLRTDPKNRHDALINGRRKYKRLLVQRIR